MSSGHDFRLTQLSGIHFLPMFREDWNGGAAFVNGVGAADCLAAGTAVLS